MAIKNKQELLDGFKAIAGDNSSDEILAFLEDVSDTLDDYETKTKDSTDWKAKFEENDASWKQRYKERFFNPEKPPEEIHQEQQKSAAEEVTFDNLFE